MLAHLSNVTSCLGRVGASTLLSQQCFICIARNLVTNSSSGHLRQNRCAAMEDVFSPELNLPTPSRSPLSAPLRLSFGESALHGTFASAPESPADSVQTDPAVHHSVLLLHPAGCMHTSRATPAAPSVDPRLLSTDRGASLRPLQLQLPSARPFERNACNCAAQQPVCAHAAMLSASHVQAAARVRTQPLEEGVLSSSCSTCPLLAPPPYPPPTPFLNPPKMSADQQYDCAQVSVLSASSGRYAVCARTSPLGEGLLSSHSLL